MEQTSIDGTGWSRFGATAQYWKDICEEETEDGVFTWSSILLKEVFGACEKDDPAELRDTLTRVTAVCDVWITDLDSRSYANQKEGR